VSSPKKIIGDSYDTAKETLDRFKMMRFAGVYDGKT
jgi:hypothetical protein